MTMSRECRSVSAVISGPLRSGLWPEPTPNTLKSREILRELQFVLAMQCDRARGTVLLFQVRSAINSSF